jgi:hypothetical protein
MPTDLFIEDSPNQVRQPELEDMAGCFAMRGEVAMRKDGTGAFDCSPGTVRFRLLQTVAQQVRLDFCRCFPIRRQRILSRCRTMRCSKTPRIWRATSLPSINVMTLPISFPPGGCLARLCDRMTPTDFNDLRNQRDPLLSLDCFPLHAYRPASPAGGHHWSG